MSDHREIVVAASALSLLMAGQTQAQDQGSRKGVAGYVRGNVQLIRAGESRAVKVRVGDPIFANQRIVTDGRSRMHLMMVDKSSITIGPNSDLRIDKYEFDKKDPSVGEMVLTSAKGLFRFVGGLLSKRNPVQVRTPTATIGIRGAVAFVEFTETGIRITFFYGNEVTVTPDGGGTSTINQPGYFVQLNNDGSSESGRLDPSEVATIASQLEGAADGQITVSSSTTNAGTTVLEIDLDNPSLNLQELENTLRTQDADFEAVRQVLEQLRTNVVGSGG
ncbi:MAG: FecR domain-containing protein [Pseudomonadota bacterium]